MPRWPDGFCLIGRGAGKDGTIALESLCLISHYNNIKGYDVDICANNEEQAMRPLEEMCIRDRDKTVFKRNRIRKG